MIAPFPWFGGKSRAARIIWEALGDDRDLYIEPFAGSLAVLLSRRASRSRFEIVNDLDMLLVNFWRALRADPVALAEAAAWPLTEADLAARNSWLTRNGRGLCEACAADPDWYDVKIAGWWVWGVRAWGPRRGFAASTWRVRPHMTRAERPPSLPEMEALAERLRSVVILAGDWRRAIPEHMLADYERPGVFLDPPYGSDARQIDLYARDDLDVAEETAAWAAEAVARYPSLRVVVAGYRDEHELLRGWRQVRWDANATTKNADREMLWLSPSCATYEQMEIGDF